MGRIACAWLPDFSLHVHLLDHPDRVGRPLVVFEEQQGHSVILGVSRAASRAGIEQGMTVSDARSKSAELCAVLRAPEREQEYLELLGESLLEFGPRVALFPPRALCLEVGGSARLFGGEAALVQALKGRLDRLGFRARTAVSETHTASRMLAEYGPRDGLLVPSGEQARALGPLPLVALLVGIQRELNAWSEGGAQEQRFVQAMGLLGVRRIRELAELPAAAVADRFGQLGLELHRRACGEPGPPLCELRPSENLLETMALDGCCAGREQLMAYLGRLLDRFTLRLQARGELVLSVGLRTLHHPQGLRETTLCLSRSTRCPRTLQRLLEERLGAVSDAGPITQLELWSVESERADGRQGDWVYDTEHRGESLSELVDRLRMSLGEGAVFSPRLRNTHRPEQRWEQSPCPTEEVPTGEAGGPISPLSRPLLLLGPPEPIQWGSGDAPFLRFRWRGRLRQVLELGPVERISGEWWAEDGGFDRDYRMASLKDGLRVWLMTDRQQGQSFVAGVFD